MGASHFVMMGEESQKRFAELISTNIHITEVHLACSAKAEEQENEKRMLHEMKVRFNPFDIQVKGISPLEMEKANDHKRGPDLGI